MNTPQSLTYFLQIYRDGKNFIPNIVEYTWIPSDNNSAILYSYERWDIPANTANMALPVSDLEDTIFNHFSINSNSQSSNITIKLNGGSTGYNVSPDFCISNLDLTELTASNASTSTAQILELRRAIRVGVVFSNQSRFTAIGARTLAELTDIDGDKGDITVSNSGSTWTVDNDAITFAKIQNIDSDRLLGRDTAGSGDVEQLIVGGGIEFTGSGGIQTSAFTGDVIKSAGATAINIAANAVTFSKMQDIDSDRLIGRDTASSGDPEALTVGGGIEFTGSGGIQIGAFTGDVSKSAGSSTLSIGTNVVSNAMLAQMPATTIKGNNSGITANVANLTGTQVTAMLDNFVGDSGAGGTKGLVPAPSSGDGSSSKFLKADGTWSAITGTGDVVGPASSTDNAVARYDGTTGKLIQNSGATIDDSGNLTANNISGTNTGDQLTFKTIAVSGQSDVVADSATDTLTLVAGSNITITTNAGADSITIAAADTDTGITELTGDVTAGPGSGSQVATIANDAVTYAKIQDVTSGSRLLGRSASGAGIIEEIVLGTNLSLSGTTLNATGGGGGSSVGAAGTVQYSDGASGFDGNTSDLFYDTTNDYFGVRNNTPLSTLDVFGSLALAITSTTSNSTMTDTRHTLLVDASGANKEVYLPPAGDCPNRLYRIKKIDSSANTVTIIPDGTETIDDDTSYSILDPYDFVVIQSDGVEWWIVG